MPAGPRSDQRQGSTFDYPKVDLNPGVLFFGELNHILGQLVKQWNPKTLESACQFSPPKKARRSMCRESPAD